jgi:hypothetical protein
LAQGTSPASKAWAFAPLGCLAIPVICVALVYACIRTQACTTTNLPAVRHANGLEVTAREVDCDPGFGAGSAETYVYLHRVGEADRKDNLILSYEQDATPEISWISPTRLNVRVRGDASGIDTRKAHLGGVEIDVESRPWSVQNAQSK